jgi:methionyl-tRNA formyltransferase
LDIGLDETAADIFEKMSQIGAQALVRALEMIGSGKAVFTPQPETGHTYASKLSEDEASIDWNMSAAAIHNKVRGMNPEPGASTCLEGLRVKIWRTQVSQSEQVEDYDPGTVIEVTKKSVTVVTGDGLLDLIDVQPAGGKKMGAADFARGKRLTPRSCRFMEPES